MYSEQIVPDSRAKIKHIGRGVTKT